MQPLQVWFSWMAKQGLILANPAADLELPRLERRLLRTILSVEQVEDILSLCDLTTSQGIREHPGVAGGTCENASGGAAGRREN